jgi:hypothetical protein
MPIDLSVVLTSAAVSALVSSLFTFISQCLERRARRRELVMKTAADLATQSRNFYLEVAKSRGGKIPPLPFSTYYYHQQLSSLFKRGKLTSEEQKLYEAFVKEINSSQVEKGAS